MKMKLEFLNENEDEHCKTKNLVQAVVLLVFVAV